MARQKQLSFVFDNLTPEAQGYVAHVAAARRRAKKNNWRGWSAVPPGSLLETVIQAFRDNTNIGLEIPFTTFMHHVAGALISADVQIDYDGHKLDADFWTVVLAGSGGGKTWTEKQIRTGLGGQVAVIDSGAASAAKWLDELAQNPRGLWIRDEFFQLLKSMERDGSPLAELKDYLLRVYDNADIVRSTKQGEVVVEHPVLSILGFTALAPFVDGMSLETLVDGFAQRFAYVLSRPDPSRKMVDFPVWNVDASDWSARFGRMMEGLHPVYKVSPEADQAFRRAFKTNAIDSMDESFFRRAMWRAHKYALVYHIIRGAAADEYLNEEDYGWASRLVELQLADAAEIIEMCTNTDIGKAIDAAEALVVKLRQQGKPVTARAIVSGTRLITTVQMARMVLGILGVAETR